MPIWLEKEMERQGWGGREAIDSGSKWRSDSWEAAKAVCLAGLIEGVSHHHLVLAETHRQAEEQERCGADKREGSQHALMEAVGQLTAAGILCDG